MTIVRAVVHDRRIEVPAPEHLADGTEVVLTIGASAVDDDGPMLPDEIARVLAAMERLHPLEIPDEVAADPDAWEKTLNQYRQAQQELRPPSIFGGPEQPPSQRRKSTMHAAGPRDASGQYKPDARASEF